MVRICDKNPDRKVMQQHEMLDLEAARAEKFWSQNNATA